MDPETRVAITPGDGGSGFSPAWAPAGDVIAFTRCCEFGDFTRLYLLRVDGGPTVKLTIPGVQSVREPAWSPDGQRIAFTCVIAVTTDVCVINRDGTGLVRLTSDDASESGPAWSPDGLFIAFSRYSPGSTPQIILVTPDGTNVTPLANGFGIDPAWSRDGAKLVFGGEGGLFTVSVDGLQKTRLTTGGHSEPAWRP
jgi:TolB protein